MAMKKKKLIMLVSAYLLLLNGSVIGAEEYQTMHTDDDLGIHRQILAESEYLCGAVYLGYVDPGCESLADDRVYLEELLIESGYTDDFNFLWNIPKECIAEVEGGMELFMIYPLDESAYVLVNQYTIDENSYELVCEKNLYRSEYGEPILLRCNATEVFWDAEVNIVNTDGRVLSWMPGMSLRDGKMEVPSEAPYVYDAAFYSAYEDENSFYGGYEAEDSYYGSYENETYDTFSEYETEAYIRPQLISSEEILTVGEEVFHYSEGNVAVYGSRVLQNEGGEILRIGGFVDGEPRWGYVLSCPYVTELLLTDVFTSGTAQDPKVILFNAEVGMMQVDILTGECMWELDREELMVGGGLCFDVTEDGTIYCGGYYDAGPTAISAAGEILWKATPSEPEIYRMNVMEVENDCLVVEYEADEGDKVAGFDLNGNVLFVK